MSKVLVFIGNRNLKINYKLVLFIVSLISLASNLWAASSPISLWEAYQTALKKSESVQIAESQQRQSEARVDQAMSGFKPSLSASVNYQKQNVPMPSVGKNEQATGKLTITQSLYAGGRDSANVSAAKSEHEAQKWNLANVQNSLYSTIAKNYYALLSAQKEVKNIETSILLNQKRTEELVQRKKIGKSRNIEVLAAQAQIAVLQAQLMTAQGQLENAKSVFINSTDLSLNRELKEERISSRSIPELSYYLKTVEERPNIQALRLLVENSSLSLEAARAAHKPSLDLSGSMYPYRYHSVSGAQDWDATLTLTIPIYAGGLTDGRVREALEKKSQSELTLAQFRREAALEIETDYQSLVSSLNQMNTLQNALKITEQNYREQEKDFRFSLATNLDVLQALNTLHETKQSLDRAHYDALLNFAKLKVATNKITE